MTDDGAAGAADRTSSEAQEASIPAEPVETEAIAEQETEPAEPSESGTSQIEPSSEPPEVLPESAPTPPEAPPEPQTAHAEAETAQNGHFEPFANTKQEQQNGSASERTYLSHGPAARKKSVRRNLEKLLTLFITKDLIVTTK